MRPLLRVLAAAFALVYVLAVGSPCTGDPIDSAGSVGAAAHDHGAHEAHHAAADTGHASDCHSAPPQLTAPCPCGCGERSATVLSSVGVELAVEPDLLEVAPPATDLRTPAPLRQIAERASEPVDHVPRHATS